ncbi:hypothetical protein DdX_17763 [Ditylenchus destructor]|uniref:Uncharacterized protein n=1 Tax=Ditylenchus destructor TaxID=166010 RepID=A0AAD4MMU6_9BILA|nr:hypothetical protein DdX_17763 [Ditylenchus destructor]
MSTIDHSATFGHLMSDPIWFDKDGKQAVFAGAEWSNIWFALTLCMSATYNAVSCCVTSWLGIATFRALKESRHSMSPMTRKMNSQMNRVLLVEVS